MNYIRLPSRPQTRDIIDTFLGYDRNQRTADGAFREMHNLSSDLYPMLSPRKKRAAAPDATEGTTGIVMKDKLCITCGTAFYHGDTRIDMGLSDGPKQLVSMGAYVIILPDRKYINTADLSDWGDIDRSFHTEGETHIYPCRANGEEINEYYGPDEPQDPADQSYWINTSEYPNTLYQWSAVTKTWTKVQATAVCITSLRIGEGLSVGDGITISGFGTHDNYKDHLTGEALNEEQVKQIRQLDGTHVVLACDRDWISIEGITDVNVVLSGVITVERKMPVVDYVVEHNNRLWGCRYGLDASGEFVNTLYASKLGDFRNWNVYRGVDTDSYYANVGTDGPFTGAISYGYGDCVLFWKEAGVHAVYGNGPGSFQTEFIACPGVQKGSAGSLAIVDGAVYYKSRTGVCRYTGSLPDEIGGAFGDVQYQDAVGGSWKHKYYLSMADPDGFYSLFAYDTRLGMWHREDSSHVIGWADCGDDAWMLLASGSRYSLAGKDGTKEMAVKWSAQTGRLGIDHPDRKRLSRINVRLRLDAGSRFRLYIRYDSAGGWIQVCSLTSEQLRAYDFPLRVRRCDHMELKLEGEGGCEVYAIVKTYRMGSDRK